MVTHLRKVLLALAALLLWPPLAAAIGPLDYYPLAPCRVLDTRLPNGPTGGPKLTANMTRSFPIVGSCVPDGNAKAVAVNAIAIAPTGPTFSLPGFISLWETGIGWPGVSTINVTAGDYAMANNAVVALDTGGYLNALAGVSDAHLVIDVVGYYK